MSEYLIAGLILFCLSHVFSVLFRGGRAALIGRMGGKVYKGVFALTIVASLLLIILGWRMSEAQPVYSPPEWGRIVTLILMFLSFILFLAARLKSNIDRLLRHPQLSGVTLWAVAHLLSNGDDRSILLFGSIGLWSLIEMQLLNRRDGAWQKPEARPAISILKPVLAGVIVCSVVLGFHGYISGVELGF